MKKILASIIIAMMLISVEVNVFADESKSTEQTTQTTSESTSKDSSITLKITEKVEVEDVTKEVKVVIGYDKLESIDTSGICMFKGIFEYSDVYFNQLTQNDIKALNGYTVQFSEESGRLLVEANRTPKDGEDVAEITLTFKEGLENVNKEKNAIMVCENLITTKGFSNCVIFVNTDSVSVVVEDDNLKSEEDMEDAMKGMLDPEYEEQITGKLEVRQIFKFSKVGLIAGCHVVSGVVRNNEKARIIRDDVVVYNGSVNTLQHEKDQVKEVTKGMDCGITLTNCQDYKEGDIIEIYDLVEIKR